MTVLERLEPRLRAILRIDAALCIVTGLIGAIGAAPIARLLDTKATVLVGVGAGALAAYGVGLAAASARSASVVLAAARLSAVGDAAWVSGSVALVVASAVAPVFLLLSLPVSALGLAKAGELRRESRSVHPGLEVAV